MVGVVGSMCVYLDGLHGGGTEAQAILHLLPDLSHEALEGCLGEEQPGGVLN